MSLKLYGYWRSSASYRVRIALNLKQLEYEYVPVHLVKDGGQQNSESYIGMNPSKLVPTFVDDDEDIILNQSMAIIEYVDEKYDEGFDLIPPHKLARARVRALSQDIGCDIQPIANLRILNHLENHFEGGADEKANWCRHWIESGFEAVEKRLQTTAGDYCFGFDVTMADIVLVPQVYNALRFNVDMDKYPLINRIYENCNKLQAFIDAAPENQVDAVN